MWSLGVVFTHFYLPLQFLGEREGVWSGGSSFSCRSFFFHPGAFFPLVQRTD
jgi:hypothetical protein